MKYGDAREGRTFLDMRKLKVSQNPSGFSGNLGYKELIGISRTLIGSEGPELRPFEVLDPLILQV